FSIKNIILHMITNRDWSEDVCTYDLKSFSALHSVEAKEHGVGYLHQQTAVQKNFPATVMEVVLSGCLKERGHKPFYSKKEKQKAIYNLKRIGMASKRRMCYCDLSGGQQQRVLIARAICATRSEERRVGEDCVYG